MDGLHEDAGDGSMLCTEHPFKNNTPAGGICAICLQEKLGKLVSSSFPIAVFPSSNSSSPSFRSEINGNSSSTTITTTITTTTTVSSAILPPGSGSNTQISPTSITSNECHYHHCYSNKSRIRYLLGQKKKKNKDDDSHDRNKNLVFKRSKSTVTPRRGTGVGAGSGLHYMDSDNGDRLTTPHKRGFWSFLYLQKHTHSSSSSKKTLRDISSNSLCASFPPQIQRSRPDTIVVEENDSPCHATFDRKVSRSRSVGCGSRSFSGDFFERISTGFGDCTLRRVESHREGKSKVSALRGGGVVSNGGQDCIKERVRCGGLFSGFMITSSSSSSSSSSYWVASNPNNEGNHTGKITSATPSSVKLSHQHSRSKSWGWALASPMRAFKPSSTKKEASNKNPTPNLSAIPSLLSVRS